MKIDCSKRLIKEVSYNFSGKINRISKINILKERNYCIIPINLGGDAPKGFIKAYFYERNSNIYKSKINTWKSYIVKSAEKWYPHESVIEFMINRFGEELGLKMNKTKLCQINGQIRFLSEYFLNSEFEELVHGAQICGEYLEDSSFAQEVANDKTTARELFTFEFITEAIKSVFKECYENLILDFVRMLTYDAIVGNNDRHFYNWGVIRNILKKTDKPTFSPIYDSARGLLWNWSDQQIVNNLKNLNSGGKKVQNYIFNACPRVSITGNPSINHFDLIKFIWDNHSKYRGTISDLLTLTKQEELINIYNLEFSFFFIKERNELIKYILKERFNKLREVAK